jgi:quinol monooxygenase YgiN
LSTGGIAPRWANIRNLTSIERRSVVTETATAVTKRLLVRIEARPGREADVESFLNQGFSLLMEEPKTTAWFAIRLDGSTFGIFDVFPEESEREAHLSGRVAAALMDKVGEHLQEPTIERIDVIAFKLPG